MKASKRFVSDEDDNDLHRIQVKDIISAKAINEKELRVKKAIKDRKESLRQAMMITHSSEQLEADFEYIAEQMALDIANEGTSADLEDALS
jgi:hypothetical protein